MPLGFGPGWRGPGRTSTTVNHPSRRWPRRPGINPGKASPAMRLRHFSDGWQEVHSNGGGDRRTAGLRALAAHQNSAWSSSSDQPAKVYVSSSRSAEERAITIVVLRRPTVTPTHPVVPRRCAPCRSCVTSRRPRGRGVLSSSCDASGRRPEAAVEAAQVFSPFYHGKGLPDGKEPDVLLGGSSTCGPRTLTYDRSRCSSTRLRKNS